MRPICLLILLSLPCLPTVLAADEVEIPHARVTFQGIDAPPAEAIARTIVAAREVYLTRFKFDMPDRVTCRVTCGPEQPTRLYTDGRDTMFLSIPSPAKLAPPRRSGVFNLYGICHELGHVAMYRLLEDRDWMSSAAAEGWAHFAGSVVVDEVFKAESEKLWHEPYDYRADGTARLRRQLEAPKPSAIGQGAGQWQALEKIIGPQGFAKLFIAWQKAKVDPLDPADALLAAAQRAHPEKKNELGVTRRARQHKVLWHKHLQLARV